MENLLHGIPCVIARVDDILVKGKDGVDHLSNLDAVLTTLSAAGLGLKKSKCEFMVAQVTYCGYRISGSGVEAVKDKVEAIQKAPEPQNVSQLRSFLGMLNYYHQFFSKYSHNLGTITQAFTSRSSLAVEARTAEGIRKCKRIVAIR